MSPANHLVVFDITHHAHYTNYLFQWLRYWIAKKPGGRLSFVVDNYLLKEHAGLRELAGQTDGSVEFVPLSPAEKQQRQHYYEEKHRQAIPIHEALNPHASKNFAGYFDWELFCHYSRRLAATHSVMAHFDHYLPLVAGGLPTPARFSAIYLGPTFHLPPDGEAFRARQIREKLLLARVLRHPRLDTLFFPDDAVVQPLQSFPESSKVVHLPDVAELPAPAPDQTRKLRDSLNLAPDAVVFLIFGGLSRRKGVEAFLSALEELKPAAASRVCLLLAGTCAPAYRDALEARIVAVEAATQARIIRRFEYIPEDEIPAYFHLANAVVTLYDRHAGISNVNLLAAAAGTPVLSSHWGTMADTADQWRLGLTADPNNAPAVAAAIGRLLDEPPNNLCDPSRMRRLAGRHTANGFCQTFFDRLFRPAT